MPSATCQKQPANEDHAFRYGRTYDSYLTTEPGWGYFRSRDRRGVVAVARKGRFLHVSGGLLASPDRKEGLLAELVEHAAQQRLVLTFFNVPEDELPLFRGFGFQATKWGEEALVDLDSCTWSGGAYEWVRRQSNFCRRQGLVFSECRQANFPPGEWSTCWTNCPRSPRLFLANKPQAREIPILEGNFDPLHLGRKRVFIARAKGGLGRVEGFLACNPCGTGQPGPWKPIGSAPCALGERSRFSCTRPCRHSRRKGSNESRCA